MSESQHRARLLGQHTVGREAMGTRQAYSILRTFASERARSQPEELRATLASRPELSQAVLAMTKARFTPLGLGLSSKFGADPEAVRAALKLLPETDPVIRESFGLEVVFNLIHPADYQILAPTIVKTIPAGEMERLLLEHVRGDNDLHLYNALHLPYYLYGRHEDYRLGEVARQDLLAAVADVGTRPIVHPLIREAWDRFVLPVDGQAVE